MTWDEIREMVSAGMFIGSHTHTHGILSGMDEASVDIGGEYLRIFDGLGIGGQNIAVEHPRSARFPTSRLPVVLSRFRA